MLSLCFLFYIIYNICSKVLWQHNTNLNGPVHEKMVQAVTFIYGKTAILWLNVYIVV